MTAPDDDWAPGNVDPTAGNVDPTAGSVDPTAGNVDPTAGNGHPRIDEALAALAEARDAPPADQVVPLTEAHRTLRQTLDSIGDV